MSSTKLVHTQQAAAVVGSMHAFNSVAIFGMYLKDIGRELLQHTAGMVLFPIAAITALIEMGLAWKLRNLANDKNGSFVNELVQTVYALGMLAAVTIGVVATSLSIALSPLIMFSVTVAKAAFHMLSTAYYYVKARGTQDADEKMKYQNAMEVNFVKAIAMTMASIAIGVGILLGKPFMAAFGVFGGVLGGVYAAYKLIKAARASKGSSALTEKLLDNHEKSDDRILTPTNSARLQAQFQPQSTAMLSDEIAPAQTVIPAVTQSVAPVVTVGEERRLGFAASY